jgi:polysaccharide export outer membrane protein
VIEKNRRPSALWLGMVVALLSAGCTAPDKSIPVGAAAYQVVPPPQPDSVPREYRIGPLDTISINVFQEPDLSLTNLSVDASGNVLLPLIGGVHAAGLTTTELSQAIAAKLNTFLVNPQVSATVVTSVSQKVTVDGSVEQPGVYAIQGRTTLIDALAMARGTNRTAALDEVIVFREINGRPAAARFNVNDIRKGRQPNPEILGSDIVVVGFSNVKGVYRDLIASSSLIASFTYLIAR